MEENKTILDNIHDGTKSYIYHLIEELQHIKYPEYFDIRKWLEMESKSIEEDKSYLLECYKGEKAKIKELGNYEDVVIIKNLVKEGKPFRLILRVQDGRIIGEEVESDKVILCIES
jgi:hypothetical protein